MSLDIEAEELALYLVDKLDNTPQPTRILVGIAGVPASGKSTLSHLLVDRINSSVPAATHDRAILVGLDGWHLSRAQLDLFPDPKQAHDRRGIHWTFDGAGYVAFVRQLRDIGTDKTVSAPSFDHALKDPTPDAVTVYPHHRIVIIEGLYAILAIQPWNEASILLDERWFVEIDPIQARRRLVERHVLTGVTKDTEEAGWRADTNDGPNGQFIIANSLEPTRIIRSKDIPNLSKTPVEAAVDSVTTFP
ncbi:hypothetical protein HYPSUDRAFT_139813 [Hypholoma sublateritium FD-334 SS-4]|uniref:Phosphoribulokinase/uridine kinase domain-containing protein n=1 Tax=Hypholoma sublateritium (strain FD-334 SS-4) TaxID=945553 RepID=A0A0D2MEC7_HYPSF|nr:hypothetical protein HYPSUDRAFT_139813 [Hypholoma sublateritium FD-334 SS-4]